VSVSITPSRAASVLEIYAKVQARGTGQQKIIYRLKRGSVTLDTIEVFPNPSGTGTDRDAAAAFSFMESPGGGAQTYSVTGQTSGSFGGTYSSQNNLIRVSDSKK